MILRARKAFGIVVFMYTGFRVFKLSTFDAKLGTRDRTGVLWVGDERPLFRGINPCMSVRDLV